MSTPLQRSRPPGRHLPPRPRQVRRFALAKAAADFRRSPPAKSAPVGSGAASFRKTRRNVSSLIYFLPEDFCIGPWPGRGQTAKKLRQNVKATATKVREAASPSRTANSSRSHPGSTPELQLKGYTLHPTSVLRNSHQPQSQ